MSQYGQEGKQDKMGWAKGKSQGALREEKDIQETVSVDSSLFGGVKGLYSLGKITSQVQVVVYYCLGQEHQGHFICILSIQGKESHKVIQEVQTRMCFLSNYKQQLVLPWRHVLLLPLGVTCTWERLGSAGTWAKQGSRQIPASLRMRKIRDFRHALASSQLHIQNCELSSNSKYFSSDFNCYICLEEQYFIQEAAS